MIAPISTAEACTTLLEQQSTGGVKDLSTDKQQQRYLIGLICIVAQCVVWVAASVMTQQVFESDEPASPFVMTYTGVALLALAVPVFVLSEKFSGERERMMNVGRRGEGNAISEADSFDEVLSRASQYNDFWTVLSHRSIQHASDRKKWNHKKHILAAVQ